jgi:hypothetical protein
MKVKDTSQHLTDRPCSAAGVDGGTEIVKTLSYKAGN